MPCNAFLLCAGLLVTGGAASAEETAPARAFRYAILVNQQEPIYGEVMREISMPIGRSQSTCHQSFAQQL